MTNVDKNADGADNGTGTAGMLLRIIGGIVAALFLAGLASGYAASASAKGALKPMDMIFLALFGVMALLCIFYAANSWKRGSTSKEMAPPSVRKSTALTLASGALGGVIAIILIYGQVQAGSGLEHNILSQAPITPASAIVLIVLMLTVLPWITWKWHHSVDEHESEAYRDGALIGIYVYSALSTCWWLGWRGGFLSAPDGLAIFMVTYLAWGGIWMWKRYR